MNPIEKFLLFVATPTVLFLALLEGVVLAWRGSYDWKAASISSADLVVRIAVNLFLPLSIADPLMRWAYQHRIATVPLAGWSTVLLLFIGQEFCYYWYHRAAHRVRWFWGNHAVHHSPNELNLAAALRIGILGKLTGTAIFFIPLVFLGFSPRTVFTVLSLNLLYQFWIHATWIPRLGWLEWILNTPSAHRVHHAANLEYLDANYGGVLIIFDRLFGTYIPERADVPCRYGWVHPLRSYNPLRIEFLQWRALALDLWRARSLRAVLGHLFMPPGWSPDGPGTTTEALRRQAGVAPLRAPDRVSPGAGSPQATA